MSEISKLDQKLIVKKIDKETLNIQILDNDILSLIVGEFNENLKKLEKLTKATYFLEVTQSQRKEALKTLALYLKQ